MKKKNIEIHCDCCGIKLYNSDVVRNDGSFQLTYIEKGEMHICLSCMGISIFNDVLGMTEIEFRELVSKTKAKKNPLERFTLEKVNFEDFKVGVFSTEKTDCLHEKCLNCKGTGVDLLGKPCIHTVSCSCSKCSVTC